MTLLSMSRPSQPIAGKVFSDCHRSVVRIIARSRGPDDPVTGDGSGFVWDGNRRFIATCHHVIGDASHISAIFDDGAGTTYKAEVVFSDRQTDVAVLRVDGPKDKLRPITAGNSDLVCVGDDAFVIGHPFGFRNSLSTGTISAIGREVYFEGENIAYTIQGGIQIDANINPGNSGGPLIDSSGKVVGMVCSIYSPSSRTSTGVGFAIPVNTISEIVEMLRREKDKRTNVGIGRPLYNSNQGNMNIPNSANGVCTMVKLEHCDHDHNNKDVIRHILREASDALKGVDIIGCLQYYGKYNMRNGDVLVCCGNCEECGKISCHVIVDKFGLDHIHLTPPAYDKRLWRKLYSTLKGMEIVYGDYDDGWEAAYEEVQSYQVSPILVNKSAPNCSLDTVNNIIDRLEIYEKVKRHILGNIKGPSIISGLAKKERSQLEELLKSFFCCCPPA